MKHDVRREVAGFTFVELLVAILILGILAGVGIPALMRYVDQARENTTKTNLKLVQQAIGLYKTDIGSYPKRLEDLVQKPSGPSGSKWKESYFKNEELPADGYDNEFYYKLTPQAKNPYELYSYGPNGPESGVEEERISVWELKRKK